MVVAKFLWHATAHSNFLEKKTLKEKEKKGKHATPEYDRFMADHQCAINFEDSAGLLMKSLKRKDRCMVLEDVNDQSVAP